MSRFIRQRFETATYDDAAGNLTPSTNIPPSYPPRLQAFAASSAQSSLVGYGTQTVASSGTAVTFYPGAQRTLLVSGDAGNVNLVRLLQTNVSLVPGGPASELCWYVGPGQLVTLPGVLNSGTIVAQAVTAALTTTANTAFSLSIAGY